MTGRHPAFIQMTAAAHWNALHGGYAPDLQHISMGVRDYLEDLWYMRTKEEWATLIHAAAGREVPSGLVCNELMQRGLLTPDGKPFSHFFGEVIADCLPNSAVFKMPDWAVNVLVISWSVLLPLAAFALFPTGGYINQCQDAQFFKPGRTCREGRGGTGENLGTGGGATLSTLSGRVSA